MQSDLNTVAAQRARGPSTKFSAPSLVLGGVVGAPSPLMGEFGGFQLVPNQRPSPLPAAILKRHPVVRDMLGQWDYTKFGDRRVPLFVGKVASLQEFRAGPYFDVTTLPIKMPATDVRVPSELERLRDALQVIIDTERGLNPYFDDSYAYVTATKLPSVPGRFHRDRPQAHSDGIQGIRYPTKIMGDHCYMVADVDPTIFYKHPFDLGSANPDTHFLNRYFEEQKDPADIYQSKPGEITLFDTYCVHQATLATAAERTFLRVTFSLSRYDREGNTHNALFAYDWSMQARPLPELIGSDAARSGRDPRLGVDLSIGRDSLQME